MSAQRHGTIVVAPPQAAPVRRMRVAFERRPEPSRIAVFVSPLIAALATLIVGFVLFTALGKDPLAAFHAFFMKPIDNPYGVSELLL